MEEFLSSNVSEFNNRQRLEFLYSSLEAKRESNPAAFNTAISWWENTLALLTRNKLLGFNSLSLDTSNLSTQVAYQQLTPSSMDFIINELLKTGKLKPEADILNPSWFAWFRAKNILVVNSLLEKAVAGVESSLKGCHTSPTNRVYTLEMLTNQLSQLSILDQTPSDSDVKIIIKTLENRKKCIINDQVVKFPTKPSEVITPADRSIALLRSSLASIQASVDNLYNQAKEQSSLARKNIAQRNLAKSHLLSSKRYTELADQRLESKSKLEQILMGIDSATDIKQTLEAIQLGTTALTEITSAPILDINNIQETMDRLDDSLKDAKEIEEAMGAALTLPDEDNDELEKELEKLTLGETPANPEKTEQEGTSDEKVPQQLEGLPSAPNDPLHAKTPTKEKQPIEIV